MSLRGMVRADVLVQVTHLRRTVRSCDLIRKMSGLTAAATLSKYVDIARFSISCGGTKPPVPNIVPIEQKSAHIHAGPRSQL